MTMMVTGCYSTVIFSNKAYVVDSLGVNNDMVSENAVLNFATKIFQAINFFRPIIGHRDDLVVTLSSIPIQRML